ncbi:MAG: hypothetical protein K6B15_07110 [Parasporobacterium sp.]|nr:hypothetical protein [Parasporobacterium sp.]
MVVEICLIIIGIIIVIISFVKTAKESTNDKVDASDIDIEKIAGDIIRDKVDKEVDNVIDDKVENFEIQIDKLSNEKIMALGDYSKTISEDTTKNHNEVLFLYNMLKDKETEVKTMMTDVENLKKSVKNMPKAAKETKKETTEPDINTVELMVSPKLEEMPLEEVEKVPEEKHEADIPVFSTKAVEEENKEKTSPQSEGENNNKDRILKLYKEGKSNVQIAKELGLGVGEVRLVVDLFKNAN